MTRRLRRRAEAASRAIARHHRQLRISAALCVLLLAVGGSGAALDADPGILIEPGRLSLEEWVVVLGPGHGYNVTRDGVMTLEDGTKIDIKELI